MSKVNELKKSKEFIKKDKKNVDYENYKVSYNLSVVNTDTPIIKENTTYYLYLKSILTDMGYTILEENNILYMNELNVPIIKEKNIKYDTPTLYFNNTKSDYKIYKSNSLIYMHYNDFRNITSSKISIDNKNKMINIYY